VSEVVAAAHTLRYDELPGCLDAQFGPTEWSAVTQPQVARFADLTHDHQWIHVDEERAKAGPFGATIAHGYLTLSLVPYFLGQLFEVSGIRMAVNYGLEKVRFPPRCRSGRGCEPRPRSSACRPGPGRPT